MKTSAKHSGFGGAVVASGFVILDTLARLLPAAAEQEGISGEAAGKYI